MGLLKTEAIKAYLELHTHEYLAKLYNANMEVQVLVAQDNGEPVDGEYKGKHWVGWMDNATGERWKSFRIPWNADTDANYEDSPISFDLAKRALGVGCTGWDWKNHLSRWVGFDFDAMTDHSEKHKKKLTSEELAAIRLAVANIPWVTIYRSTSGNGLHLYVFLKPYKTDNHSEHAAVARAILGQLSMLCGVDFQIKVDACGGNMWLAHRKMKGTDGLKLIKQGSLLEEIPPNWRDHIKVVKGERKKVLPFFIADSKNPGAESDFDQLCGQRMQVGLDDEHRKHCAWLVEKSGGHSSWNSDHHMLITHTSLLAEMHQELGLRGKFETLATGKDSGRDHNCFCYPLRNGGWAVRRYTQGITEASTWEQDAQGWTKCTLNCDADLQSACRAYEGKERSAGGYVFDRAEQATQAAALLGATVDLPGFLGQRRTIMKHHKDGRLVVRVDRDKNDVSHPKLDEGWNKENTYYEKLFRIRQTPQNENESINLDETIRHVVSEDGKDMGWLLLANSQWQEEPLHHVKPALSTFGLKEADVKLAIGASVFKAWILVCRPFEPEYLGDRQWNRNAPQLKYIPTDEEQLHYPTWASVFKHCGTGLDCAISEDKWCRQNGITDGSKYLMCWVASMIQQPMEPLPYLFFWSTEQNTGKSTFHEALSLLLTCGYMRAEAALTSPGQFNGELLNTVLCVTEEIDLKKNMYAYQKIKDWVTARHLSIHMKGKTPFMVPNTTHWIQCSNSHLSCPIFAGDSRITMLHVPELDLMDMRPKKQLIPMLEKEAPHFVAALRRIELPASPDRLNIPVINTPDKIMVEEHNMTLIEQYIAANYHYVPGAVVTWSEFFDEFREYIEPGEWGYWTKIKAGRALPPQYPKGRLHKNPHFHVGNLRKDARKPGESVKPKLILRGEYLEEEGGKR